MLHAPPDEAPLASFLGGACAVSSAQSASSPSSVEFAGSIRRNNSKTRLWCRSGGDCQGDVHRARASRHSISGSARIAPGHESHFITTTRGSTAGRFECCSSSRVFRLRRLKIATVAKRAGCRLKECRTAGELLEEAGPVGKWQQHSCAHSLCLLCGRDPGFLDRHGLERAIVQALTRMPIYLIQ